MDDEPKMVPLGWRQVPRLVRVAVWADPNGALHQVVAGTPLDKQQRPRWERLGEMDLELTRLSFRPLPPSQVHPDPSRAQDEVTERSQERGGSENS